MTEQARDSRNQPDLEWASISSHMTAMRDRVEPELREMTPFVGVTGEFCRKLLRQVSSDTGVAASEKVAIASCIQAFRTAVAVVDLSLAGYGDIAASLVRTIWELHVRLNRIRDDGEDKALAYMHHTVEREIEIRKLWLRQTAEPTARLEQENALATWVAGKRELESLAAARGVSAKDLKRLGSERLVNAAEKVGLKDEFATWHAAMSQITHGGGAPGTYDDVMDYVDEGSSILLPVDSHGQYMVAHALTNALEVMRLAAEILGDVETMLQVAQTNKMLGRVIGNTMTE